MERILVAATLIVVAVGVAALLRRRRSDGPTQTSWAVPTQLDPADLGPVATPWTIVTFTSATCDSCAAVLQAVATLVDPGRVAAVDLEVAARPEQHRRYGIDAVPTLVLVDSATGRVRASVVGPLHEDDVTHLRALATQAPLAVDDGTPVELP